MKNLETLYEMDTKSVESKLCNLRMKLFHMNEKRPEYAKIKADISLCENELVRRGYHVQQ